MGWGRRILVLVRNKNTGEIGRVRIGKIENKGRHNRRVNVRFVDA